jgi:hypothetical protein
MKQRNTVVRQDRVFASSLGQYCRWFGNGSYLHPLPYYTSLVFDLLPTKQAGPLTSVRFRPKTSNKIRQQS